MQQQIKNYKLKKLKEYTILNKYVKSGQILFVGSSLMEFFPINEFQQNLDKKYIIYNRGIAGYVTADLLNSMNECIFDLKPSKLFINIGTNDITSIDGKFSLNELVNNYDKILSEILNKLPECKVYIMAYYPVNAEDNFDGISKEMKQILFSTRTNENIEIANTQVELLAQKYNYNFINVNKGLIDNRGNLKFEYSVDGIHMYANAYSIILENLKEFL